MWVDNAFHRDLVARLNEKRVVIFSRIIIPKLEQENFSNMKVEGILKSDNFEKSTCI